MERPFTKKLSWRTLVVFQYDDQKTIYEGVRSLCDSAIKYLKQN